MLRFGLVGLALLAAPVDAHIARAADAGTPDAVAGASIAAQLIAAFDRVFKGPYDDGRAIHAKGIILRGDFTADPDAISLTSAAQFQPDGSPVPVIVRFSEFSGIPSQIDGRPGTNPTGMAIKFALPGGIDTDIVAHSYNGFPVATPEEFLEYLNALVTPDAAVRDAFLASHQAARQFIDDPKPTPVSYATDTYYGVDAFRFTNAAAVGRFGRYRIEPVAGAQHLSAPQAADIKPDYLRDELRQRLNTEPARFRLYVQLAAPEDDPSDATKAWPADRPQVLLGTLSLTQIADETAPEIRKLFFNPMNLVPGITASADPLLVARSRSYVISYRRRLAGK
jgi:catalase